MSDYFRGSRKVATAGHHCCVVAAVLSRHGFASRNLLPVLAGFRDVLTSPVSFLQRPARWMQLLASNSHALSAGPNFAFELAAERHQTTTWPGLISATCSASSTVAERVQPGDTAGASPSGSPASTFTATALRPSYGMAEATVYVATRERRVNRRQSFISTPRSCPPATRSGAQAEAVQRWSATACRGHRWCGSSIPRPGIECPAGTVGEIWVHGDNVAAGYWQKPARD